jgi:hypothetical protein
MARTAEEFIINKFKIDIMPNELTFFHEQLFELMESYHQEKLQEELQRYEIFKAVNRLDDCENMTYEEIIDNYLNSR